MSLVYWVGLYFLLVFIFLSAIHGAIILSRCISPTQPEETYSMVTANWSKIFGVAFSNKRWLHFFMLFVPLAGIWTSSIGIIGLAFNLRAYDFISQELKAAEEVFPRGNSLHFSVLLSCYI